jgi:hypothetical protein
MIDRATVRLHAVALTATSWLIFAWTQSVPGLFDRFGLLRGMDFLQFYAAGWFVGCGRTSELYDFDTFARSLSALVPGIGELLFLPVYPPQVALVFAPLSRLPYLAALGAWTLISVTTYLATASIVLRRLALRRYHIEAWWLILAFPPFLQLVAHGQVAALAMPLLAAAMIAFRGDRPALVGLALGSMAFKPQLGTFTIAAMALWPSWRLAAGVAAGIAAQAALVVATLGAGMLWDYADVLLRVTRAAGQFEPKPWAMHGIRGALELLLPSGGAVTLFWLVLCVGVLWIARQGWRRHAEWDVRFALVGLTGLLMNPHLYVYDLVLLGIPLGCLANWLVRRDFRDRNLLLVAYAAVWLPLVAPLAAVTHVQLTSPLLTLLIWLVARAGETSTTHVASR